MIRPLLCFVAILITIPRVAAQEDGNVRRGLAFAEANCASCHGVRPDAVGSPRTGVATFKTIANTPGMSAMALSVWLQSTHREMPNFIIPPEDRADVIAYILSLRERGRPQ